MKPEMRPEAGTIYDSRPFKSSDNRTASGSASRGKVLLRKTHPLAVLFSGQQRAREVADAGDEVGTAVVLLDL